MSCYWKNTSYGAVTRGDTIIEFGEARKEYAGSGICIVRVKDADVDYNEWKLNGVEFLGDFAERDYGSIDFREKDNNGNVLVVGRIHTRKQRAPTKIYSIQRIIKRPSHCTENAFMESFFIHEKANGL